MIKTLTPEEFDLCIDSFRPKKDINIEISFESSEFYKVIANPRTPLFCNINYNNIDNDEKPTDIGS